MKYVILEAGDINDLALKVELLIEDGWEPYGGVAVEAHESYRVKFFQAMTKREPIPVTGKLVISENRAA